MSFTVMVADNFHYGDEDETYSLGTFDELDAAASAAMHIVDEYLESAFKPGMTAAELYDSYKSFGEDPYIVPADPDEYRFSAWEYAEQRSAAICSAGRV